MPAETSELKIRDVAIKLHRTGRGPRVLFLHGAGGVPQWLPFFDALAERYELWVPEHPGFGGSDDPPWIHSMPDLAMFYRCSQLIEGPIGVTEHPGDQHREELACHGGMGTRPIRESHVRIEHLETPQFDLNSAFSSNPRVP